MPHYAPNFYFILFLILSAYFSESGWCFQIVCLSKVRQFSNCICYHANNSLLLERKNFFWSPSVFLLQVHLKTLQSNLVGLIMGQWIVVSHNNFDPIFSSECSQSQLFVFPVDLYKI